MNATNGSCARHACRACSASLLLLLALALTLPAACGFDQDHDGAKQRYRDFAIRERGYHDWASPPGFADKRTSHTLHSDAVRIYVSDEGAAAMQDCAAYYRTHPDPTGLGPYFRIPEGSAAATAWPDGTVFIKEGFDGAELAIVALMHKRDGAWFYAEYDGDGEVLFSGRPDICVDCHAGAKDDFVFSAQLSILCREANLEP